MSIFVSLLRQGYGFRAEAKVGRREISLAVDLSDWGIFAFETVENMMGPFRYHFATLGPIHFSTARPL